MLVIKVLKDIWDHKDQLENKVHKVLKDLLEIREMLEKSEM